MHEHLCTDGFLSCNGAAMRRSRYPKTQQERALQEIKSVMFRDLIHAMQLFSASVAAAGLA